MFPLAFFFPINEQEVPRVLLTANNKHCLHLSTETDFTPNNKVFWHFTVCICS